MKESNYMNINDKWLIQIIIKSLSLLTIPEYVLLLSHGKKDMRCADNIGDKFNVQKESMPACPSTLNTLNSCLYTLNNKIMTRN